MTQFQGDVDRNVLSCCISIADSDINSSLPVQGRMLLCTHLAKFKVCIIKSNESVGHLVQYKCNGISILPGGHHVNVEITCSK